MENVKSLIDELRKHGLSNGSSLGYHSGLMDEAADTIEQLLKELKNAKTEAYKEFIEKVKENSNKIDVVCSGALVTRDYTISKQKLDNLLKEIEKKEEV